MLIGDQIATDGILARRLGYAFVLYDASVDGVPLGPRLLGAFGKLVRSLLFIIQACRLMDADVLAVL
jgi:hypothetical protein